MPFEKWKDRLAGKPVKNWTLPDAHDEGYYRKPITQKKIGVNGQPNGQTETIGWIPVAYFLDGETLVCLLGNKEVDANDEQLWSYVVSNPISYETYKAVAEGGEAWPDKPSRDHLEVPPAKRSENVGGDEPAKPKAPVSAEDYAAIIDALVASTEEAKVESDADANSVTGSINKLAEARLSAQHAGEAIYKPLWAHYKAAYDKWTPMVKTAEACEKRLSRLVLVYREKVRQDELREAEQARKAAEAEAEAAARAADRAIANGEPEPAPDLSEPAPPPPPRTVAPTHGKRKVREQIQIFVEIADIDMVFAYFRNTTEVKAVLTTLATAAVKAGRDVPGITKREGLI